MLDATIQDGFMELGYGTISVVVARGLSGLIEGHGDRVSTARFAGNY